MIFGVPGYLVRKFELNNAAIVLALILGSLGEKGLHRSFLISDGNPAIFFESPVCIVLINLCFFWNSKSNFHGKTGIKNAEKSD